MVAITVKYKGIFYRLHGKCADEKDEECTDHGGF
jgi:hypothetical protein